MAIENARLFERARSQASTLLLLNEVGREASSILDVEVLLRRAAELVKRVIDYQIMSILLYDARHESLSAASGREVRPEPSGQAARGPQRGDRRRRGYHASAPCGFRT